jgi:hypothetical protein
MERGERINKVKRETILMYMYYKKLMEKIMSKPKGKEFLQEIAKEQRLAKSIKEEEVEEIAEKVAKEAPEFLQEIVEQEEGKMNKGEFLESVGLGDRPGSQLASTKWEEYCAGI